MCFLWLCFETVEIGSSEESSRAGEMEKQSTPMASVFILKIRTILLSIKWYHIISLSDTHTHTTRKEQSKCLMHISYGTSSGRVSLKLNQGPFSPLSALIKWNIRFYFISLDSLQMIGIKIYYNSAQQHCMNTFRSSFEHPVFPSYRSTAGSEAP